MEKFQHVAVFSPITILENTVYDLDKPHDSIISGMLDEEFWQEYERNYKTFFDIHPEIDRYILHPRASYLASVVGFSVLYETETQYMFYIGDIITIEMMEYIEKNCQNKTKQLSFVTWLNDGMLGQTFYTNETNKQEISHEQDFLRVMLDLKQILGAKQESYKKSR